MAKVSIMIDVSDEVMEGVVAPFKSNKKFSKLMVSLLNAYHNSSVVRDVVNGVVEKDNLQSIKSLQDQLLKAERQSKALSSVTKSSMLAHKEGLDRINNTVENVTKSSEEIDNLGLDTLIEQNNKLREDLLDSQNKFMEDVLKAIQGHIPALDIPKPNIAESRGISNTSVSNSEPTSTISVPTFTDDDDLSISFEEEEGESDNTTVDPDDFLSNLLGGGDNTFFG